VPIDEFGQCQSNGIAEAGALKPGFRMSNDPFSQGALEQIDLVHHSRLVVQPANLIGRELGLNPGINPMRFVATVGLLAVWVHTSLETGRATAGPESRFLLNERSEPVFQKYFGTSGPAVGRIYAEVFFLPCRQSYRKLSKSVYFLQIILLGLIQGAAELLPVSSSAHVIVAEKLMGLDPSSPEMTFVLVMLHTGTMFAVIVYFWSSWREHYFSSVPAFRNVAINVVIATVLTAIVGVALQLVIEKVFLKGPAKAEVEVLFSNLALIAGALLAAGLLIIYSGLREEKNKRRSDVSASQACWIGAVQGLCLPFRGFSRSGATISTGLLLGVGKRRMEEFSFALAVVLTPPVILRSLWRLIKEGSGTGQSPPLVHAALPGLFGMVCSFVAGWLALKLLSRWLESGRWKFFGYYCIGAAIIVFGLALAGF
jgi:undecaprenyl-diphosphatase